MSQLTDDEIVAALRQAVPEPPVAPDRVSAVHHRARVHRRTQLSAVALGLVAVVGASTAVIYQQSPAHSYAGLAGAPTTTMTGIPARSTGPRSWSRSRPAAPARSAPRTLSLRGKGSRTRTPVWATGLSS